MRRAGFEPAPRMLGADRSGGEAGEQRMQRLRWRSVRNGLAQAGIEATKIAPRG